jgi:hypothetical protein
MKNSLVLLLLFVTTILSSLLLTWWVIAPLALALTYYNNVSTSAGFVIPFVAVFLAWLLSIYLIDTGAVSILLGELFSIAAFATPLLAAMIGGLLAGLFGWAGALLAPTSNGKNK